MNLSAFHMVTTLIFVNLDFSLFSGATDRNLGRFDNLVNRLRKLVIAMRRLPPYPQISSLSNNWNSTNGHRLDLKKRKKIKY